MEGPSDGNLTSDLDIEIELDPPDTFNGVTTFQLITEGYLIFIIGCIGLLGNVISIWTFSRQRIHRIFHNLLLVLTIFDTVRHNSRQV